MKIPLDILYILLDYCNPMDTNILTVIETIAKNSQENEFDNFTKYSIQKTKRDRINREKFIKDYMKEEREKQLKQFEKMKKENNYNLIHPFLSEKTDNNIINNRRWEIMEYDDDDNFSYL